MTGFHFLSPQNDSRRYRQTALRVLRNEKHTPCPRDFPPLRIWPRISYCHPCIWDEEATSSRLTGLLFLSSPPWGFWGDRETLKEERRREATLEKHQTLSLMYAHKTWRLGWNGLTDVLHIQTAIVEHPAIAQDLHVKDREEQRLREFAEKHASVAGQ